MNWKRCVSVLLVIGSALSAGPVVATAQIPDAITIDGKQYPLNTNPLDRHLVALGDAAPKFDVVSSALWRGYIASWELKDGNLFLRSISIPRYSRSGEDNKPREALRKVFPGSGEIVADWYSGALIIPDGEMVDYVHMGYGSTYERYIIVVVRQGIERKRLRLSEQEFRQYRDAQFWKFKTTDGYRDMVEDLKAEQSSDSPEYRMSDAQIDGFIREFSAEEYLSIIDDEDPAEGKTE